MEASAIPRTQCFSGTQAHFTSCLLSGYKPHKGQALISLQAYGSVMNLISQYFGTVSNSTISIHPVHRNNIAQGKLSKSV
jgi:hypothetical protein